MTTRAILAVATLDADGVHLPRDERHGGDSCNGACQRGRTYRLWTLVAGLPLHKEVIR